jgi:hypothetical protein
MVIFDYNMAKPEAVTTIKRSWKNFSKSKLCNMFRSTCWELQIDLVQDCWNELEHKPIQVVDTLVP